jgi:glutaredoxin
MKAVYTLYTSDTCPKGVQAREFLQARGLAFTEQNLDQTNNSEQLDALRRLLQSWSGVVTNSVVLPVLTHMAATTEEIVAVGFQAAEWKLLVTSHGGKQFSSSSVVQKGA